MFGEQRDFQVSSNSRQPVKPVVNHLLRMLFAIGICTVLSLSVSSQLYAAEWVLKTPRVRLFPPQGPVGTLVYVGVIDYPRLAPITVLVEEQILAELYTDESGYAFTSFVVENGPGGPRSVTVKSATEVRTVHFYVTPRCLLSNHRASPGDVLTISATGLRPNAFLLVKIASQTIQTLTTSESGEVNAEIVVPEIGCGTYNLSLTEGERHISSLQLEVIPKVYLSHYKACVGEEVVLYGSGLSANSEAEILFDDSKIATSKISKDGNLKTLIRVPNATGGTHRISVANAGKVSSVNLNLVPSVSIRPSAGNINAPVSISGMGFRAHTLVTVSYDDTIVGSATSTGDGSVSFSFSIPRSSAGRHTITVSDGTSQAKAEFSVESVPPKSPNLLEPNDRASLKDKLKFRWEPVTDPSGVSYIFQIGRDLDFTDTPVNISNYTQTEYTLPPETRLPPSGRYGYYWRVKAVDGANNESPWSEARSFTISITLGNWVANMPAWIKATLLGIGFLFFAIVFFWIGTITRITIERRALAAKRTTSAKLPKPGTNNTSTAKR